MMMCIITIYTVYMVIICAMCYVLFTSVSLLVSRSRKKYWSHSWENLSPITHVCGWMCVCVCVCECAWNLVHGKTEVLIEIRERKSCQWNENRIYYEFMDMDMGMAVYARKFKYTRYRQTDTDTHTRTPHIEIKAAGIRFNSYALLLNVWNVKWNGTSSSWWNIQFNILLSIYLSIYLYHLLLPQFVQFSYGFILVEWFLHATIKSFLRRKWIKSGVKTRGILL